MKKLSFVQDNIHFDLSLLQQRLNVREIDWSFPEEPPLVDLVELFLEVEAAVAQDRGSIVQFVGASPGPGSMLVAFDMAWAAVTVLEKKLLVLNCTRTPWNLPLTGSSEPFDDVAVHPMSVNDELVKVSGHELYMANLRNWPERGASVAKVEDIRTHLEDFCRYFDMVALVAPSIDRDPLGPILARHADGNILVIEAERTHRSAAIRLREILSRSGRPILGAVLHDRKNHIPPWLTRLL